MAGRPLIARIAAAPDVEPDFADYFERRGYDVRVAAEEWSATAMLEGGVDVAIVDFMLPDASGLDLLRRFARRGGAEFILVGRSPDLIDRVLALELGAADVLARPVLLRELVTRVNGLLVRSGRLSSSLVLFENSTVDLKASLVMHHSGAEEQLSPGQIALIRLFADNPRRVLAREDIMAAAPAESFDAFDRSVDSRIVRLRRKLDTETIVTVRGAGYRFDPPS